MKLKHSSTPVQMSGSLQVSEFSIKNSRKSFQLLSSGLYSNKIRAVIREIYCNALDSHRAAGTDRPVTVHLPNRMEPWFSVRDYGIGLNDEEISGRWVDVPTYDERGFVNLDASGEPIMTRIRRGGIYNTYFESTKTESNDYIGALGLGSKSPFSYTDNFTVTAIKDGVKRIYTAYIGEQGTPSVTMMHEGTSDEATGLEVSMSVTDHGDFSKFREEYTRVIQWVREKPELIGDTSPGVPDVEYSVRDLTPGVHVLSGASISYALMGNIAYPLNDLPNAQARLGDNRAGLLTAGLVFEFDIGELDFAASRESLSYIPETVDAIQQKLDRFLSEVTKAHTDRISGFTRYQKIQELTRIYTAFRWGRWQVADIIKNDPELAPIISPTGSSPSTSVWLPAQALHVAGYTLTRYRRPYYGYRQTSRWGGAVVDTNPNYRQIFSLDSSLILLDDRGAGLPSTLTTANLAHGKLGFNVEAVYVVARTDGKLATDADYAAVQTMFYDAPVRLATTVTGAPTSPKRRSKTDVVFEFNSFRSYYGQSANWTSIPISTLSKTNDIPYVSLTANTIKTASQASFLRRRDLLFREIYDGPIYGVRDSAIQHLTGHKMVPLEKFIADLVSKMSEDDILNALIQSSDNNSGLVELTKLAPSLSKTLPLTTRAATLKDTKVISVSVACESPLYAKLEKALSDERTALYDSYPLLRHVPIREFSSKEVLQYIGLVDQQRAADDSLDPETN